MPPSRTVRVSSPRPPLALWLFLAALAATVAAVGFSTAWADRLLREQVRASATATLQAQATALRDALDRGMEQHLAQVRAIGTLEQLQPPAGRVADPARMRAALESFQRSFPQVAWMGVADPQGKVLAGVNGLLEGADVGARPWFKAAREGQVYVGDVHAAVLLARLLPARAEPWRFVDFAVPVRDASGRVTSILGAHLSWAWAAELKRDLADRAAAAHGAEALVLDAKGNVLLGPPGLEGRQLDIGPAATAGWLAADVPSAGHGDFHGLGWHMVVRQPESVAMAGYARMRWNALLAALAIVVLLSPALWWMAHRLSAPLRTLARSLDPEDAIDAPAPRLFFREAHMLAQTLSEHDRRQREHAESLQALAIDLELRVHDRTRELTQANDRLTATLTDLARSEERTSSLLRYAPDAFVSLDADGLVTDWNRAAESLFGWERHEALGQRLSSLIIPPAMRARHDEGMARFSRSGDGPVIGQRLELPALHRDGRTISIEISVGALGRDGGFVAFAFARDIAERKAAERRLADSERRLQEVLGNLPAMVGHFDREERCLFANEMALKVHGFTRETAQGRQLSEGLDPRVYALHAPHVRRVLAGERVQFEFHVDERAGRGMQDFQVNLVPELDAAGAVQGFYLLTFDVTPLQAARRAMERGERRLRAIADNLPAMISYIDDAQRLQFTNRTFEQWTGIVVADAIGRPLREVIGEALFAQRAEPLARALAGERVEFEMDSHAQGAERHLQTTYIPDRESPEAPPRGVYALTLDVTALRAAERRMAEIARSDPLTGLPNRRRFDERLPEALARARRARCGTALLFLDVDRFKQVNDTFGHAAGDAVLVQFAARLSAVVRSTDFVARLAGDEFVVVLEGLHHADESDLVAAKLVAAARVPMPFGDTQLQVSTSIGIAYLPAETGTTCEALLKLADDALYRAKHNGRDGHARSDAVVQVAG